MSHTKERYPMSGDDLTADFFHNAPAGSVLDLSNDTKLDLAEPEIIHFDANGGEVVEQHNLNSFLADSRAITLKERRIRKARKPAVNVGNSLIIRRLKTV